MATWLSIHLKSNDLEKTKQLLIDSVDGEAEESKMFPNEFHNSYLFDPDAFPSYFAVAQTQADWITIRYNALGKINEWCIELSKQLNCELINVRAQNTSDAYSLTHISNGSSLRDVEYSPENEETSSNRDHNSPWKKFEWDGETSFYIDFSSIEEYCDNHGLQLQTEYEQFEWTTIKDKNFQLPTHDIALQFKESRNPKPWWKFW